MRKIGINMELVKQQNRSLILHTITRLGPVSRKDLAFLTHLTPASITVTTTALLNEGVLVEAGKSRDESSGAGRSQVLLDINTDNYKVCTVNIEADDTTISLCDCKGRLLENAGKKLLLSIQTNKEVSPEEFLHTVALKCRSMIESLPQYEQSKIRCVSVALTGILDKATGISEHAIGVWNREVNVAEVMKNELGLPVLLSNNVDAFSRAVLLYGMGRTHDNLLVIKWGPGIGCTVIIDGEIYEGRNGISAEMGHVIVRPYGRQCSCGRRGCLETVASYYALQRTLQFAPDKFEEAFLKADEKVQEEIREKIDLFARCLLNTATIIAPDRIILCGKLFRGEAIRNELIASFKKHAPTSAYERLTYTVLADEEGYIGPVAVFAENILLGNI